MSESENELTLREAVEQAQQLINDTMCDVTVMLAQHCNLFVLGAVHSHAMDVIGSSHGQLLAGLHQLAEEIEGKHDHSACVDCFECADGDEVEETEEPPLV